MIRTRALLLTLLLALPHAAQAAWPARLPPQQPCKPSDITGQWRLARAWEEPEDIYTREQRAYRAQYFQFEAGGRYYELYSATFPRTAQQLGEMLTAYTASAPLQYVLSEQGVLYLYRAGKVTVSAYCNIVPQTFTASRDFRPGDMWLYQATKQPEKQVVRRYMRAFTPRAAAPPGLNVPQPPRLPDNPAKL